jgi:hypothetical protein
MRRGEELGNDKRQGGGHCTEMRVRRLSDCPVREPVSTPMTAHETEKENARVGE